jgi:hypothetical protein
LRKVVDLRKKIRKEKRRGVWSRSRLRLWAAVVIRLRDRWTELAYVGGFAERMKTKRDAQRAFLEKERVRRQEKARRDFVLAGRAQRKALRIIMRRERAAPADRHKARIVFLRVKIILRTIGSGGNGVDIQNFSLWNDLHDPNAGPYSSFCVRAEQLRRRFRAVKRRCACRCGRCECESCNPKQADGRRMFQCADCHCFRCYATVRRDCGNCSCIACYGSGAGIVRIGRSPMFCYRCNCEICYPGGMPECRARACGVCGTGSARPLSSPIQSHSFKPAPVFFDWIPGKGKKDPGQESAGSRPKSARYFGVELEMESAGSALSPADVARWINANCEARYYCKHDGSLANGVEVVSHPASFAAWCARGPLIDFAHYAATNGFRSYQTNTCGMHVHVSRNNLSAVALARLLTFMRSNYWAFVKFSKRDRAAL